MGMVSWVRDLLHLGENSREACDELQKELERSHAVKSDMDRLRKELQLKREAVHAKARAVLNQEPEKESDRSPLAAPRSPLKSSA